MALRVKSIKNLKSLKYNISLINVVFATNLEVKMKKYVRKKNQLKY